MRFSPISARFGHQLATFCFDNARLRRRYQKQYIFCIDCWFPSILVSFAPELASRDEIFPHICAVWASTCNVLFRQCPFTQEISETVDFSYRLLVSVDIGLVCSWVGVAGWDFPPYLRGLVISLQRFFFQCSFLQETSKTAYFLYRLLVSVDIGLVCSWVGVAGWDFPPYLRGLVINLQRFVSTMPVYAGDIKNSIFFVQIASFRRYWSRLLLSWRRGMRFSPISARFGHQLATFCFDNARLRSRYQKQYIFRIDC